MEDELEKLRQYKIVTKSRLKEAAGRLMEYRQTIEKLTQELSTTQAEFKQYREQSAASSSALLNNNSKRKQQNQMISSLSSSSSSSSSEENNDVSDREEDGDTMIVDKEPIETNGTTTMSGEKPRGFDRYYNIESIVVNKH